MIREWRFLEHAVRLAADDETVGHPIARFPANRGS